MPYDIRLVKLINGETVLGKWDEEHKKLTDVAVLQSVPTAQGGVQMMMLPFGYPFENEFGGEIKEAHLLYVYKGFPEDIKTKYLEAVSNLTLSTASDLRKLDNMAAKSGSMSKLLIK